MTDQGASKPVRRLEGGELEGLFDLFKVVDGEWVFMRTVEAKNGGDVLANLQETGRWYIHASYGPENIVLPTHVPTVAPLWEDIHA